MAEDSTIGNGGKRRRAASSALLAEQPWSLVNSDLLGNKYSTVNFCPKVRFWHNPDLRVADLKGPLASAFRTLAMGHALRDLVDVAEGRLRSR